MNTEKGSLEGVLPMLALLILSAALAVQGIPIADAIEDLALEASGDITNIAETRSKAEHTLYHHVPFSGVYTVNNAAYELGKDNAGVSWDNIPGDNKTLYTEMEEAWEDDAGDRLNDMISDSSSCSINPTLDVQIYPEKLTSETFDTNLEDANFWVLSEYAHTDDTAIEFICSDSESIVFKETNYRHNDTASDNRYGELIKYASSFYTSIEDEFEDTELEEEYDGEASSCGSEASALSQARRNAYNSYESDTPSASSISSEIDTASNISVSTSQSDNANEDFSNYRESECSCECLSCKDDEDGESVDDCSCGDECEDDQRDYTKTANGTITPTDSSIELDVTDDYNEPFIDGEYRGIELNIDDYTFDWN